MGAKMIRSSLAIAAGALIVAAASPALAGPTCTTETKDKWVSEDAMKQRIAELGYKDIKLFKTTKGRCYEIYGHDKDGKKVEVYFNPLTMAIVQSELKNF